MKTPPVLLSVAVFFAVVGAPAVAANSPLTLADAAPHPSAAELAQPAPRTLDAVGPEARHLYPVRDEKGLLLSCVAPEMDVNHDTDVFHHCTLAPGRTLDDFMHSVMKAVHQEQAEQQKTAASDDDKESTAGQEKSGEKALQ